MSRRADMQSSRQLVRRFGLLLLFALVVLSGRLVQLHVGLADSARERVAKLSHRERVIPARRGDLLDRHGRVLATTESLLRVEVWPPNIVHRHQDPGERVRKVRELAAVLAPLVQSDTQLLVEQMFSDRNQQLGILVSDPVAQRVLWEDEDDLFEDLDMKFVSRRRYPWGAVAGNVLGYLDHEGGGAEGLEAGLQSLLSGRDGSRQARIDVAGDELAELDPVFEPPVHGLDVTLTLDAVIQKMLREELLLVNAEQEAERSVGVVLDARTGELLALSSVPGLDPDDRATLDPSAAVHGAWQEIYAPGSTFKPLMMAAALDLGLTHPDEPPLECTTYDFRPTKDTHPQDHPLTLEEILVHSSNIGMGKLLTRITPKERRKDTEAMAPLYHLLKRLGLGANTGLPLRAEARGSITPLAKWDRDWTVASISRGQEIALTPIQMAAAANSLTDGLYRAPRLVAAVARRDGVREELTSPPPAPVFRAETADRVRRFMREVVLRGSCQELLATGLSLAGKTGTADHEEPGHEGEEIHSFVALCPAEDPVITVVIEVRVPRAARYASQSAAPATGRFLSRLAPYLGLDVEEPAG